MKINTLYRTVAAELANQEEEELFAVISDVKGFLHRPDGIPAYVSKEQLFTELTKIVRHHHVAADKKVEAIELSGKLLKNISSRQNRRKNSHVSSELTTVLDVLIPVVILHLASKEASIHQANLKLIQDSVKNSDLKSDIIEHIAGNGVRHKSDKISLETMKLLPGIYAQDIQVCITNVLLTSLLELMALCQSLRRLFR